jgi:molybdopterin synthase sulfur carrier subunit
MRVRIRYFAVLRELVGQEEEIITVPAGSQVADVRSTVLARYPRLQPFLERSLCAVNREYVAAERELQDGDEVVFVPPLGGGTEQVDPVNTPQLKPEACPQPHRPGLRGWLTTAHCPAGQQRTLRVSGLAPRV